MDDEALLLDPQMDYASVRGLSSEVRERLYRVRPTTMVRVSNIVCIFLAKVESDQGAAKRMEGMTPTSVVCLLRHAKRTHRASEDILTS